MTVIAGNPRKFPAMEYLTSAATTKKKDAKGTNIAVKSLRKHTF